MDKNSLPLTESFNFGQKTVSTDRSTLPEVAHLRNCLPKNFQKVIFHLKFPWNSAHFGIILMDFQSSTNWAMMIYDEFPGVEIPKIAGIQSNINPWYIDKKSEFAFFWNFELTFLINDKIFHRVNPVLLILFMYLFLIYIILF